MAANNTTAAAVILSDSLLTCKDADMGLMIVIVVVFALAGVIDFKEKLTNYVFGAVSVVFVLLLSVHLYERYLDKYFIESAANWVVWVFMTVIFALVIVWSQNKYMILALVFLYVAEPFGVVGLLLVSLLGPLVVYACIWCANLQDLFDLIIESCMLGITVFIPFWTLVANAGAVTPPADCSMGRFNGAIVCDPRCKSITSYDAPQKYLFVAVYVGIAYGLLRTIWIKGRPSEGKHGRGDRLYFWPICCCCCPSCCPCHPIASKEYSELNPTKANKKKTKTTENVKAAEQRSKARKAAAAASADDGSGVGGRNLPFPTLAPDTSGQFTLEYEEEDGDNNNNEVEVALTYMDKTEEEEEEEQTDNNKERKSRDDDNNDGIDASVAVNNNDNKVESKRSVNKNSNSSKREEAELEAMVV